MKIVFLDTDSIADADLASINQQGDLSCYATIESKQQLADFIQDAEVIISNKIIIDKAALALAPKLKLICVAATGYNNIDIAAAEKHNVAVCNVAGYSTTSVAQHVFAMLLNWSIQLNQYHNACNNGEWQQSELFCLLDYPIVELAEQSLGIIGYGDIGKAVEKVAQAFGMKVLIAERENAAQIREGRTDYQTVLETADVISLHCPLTPDNTGMVNETFLSQMKSSAILINTARGGLIDETALANALTTKQIQAALLDGLSVEPPPKHHPLLNNIENLVITPHTAWASKQARQTLVDEIAKNIESFKNGNLRNQIKLN